MANTGIVKSFGGQKKYGFIGCDQIQGDVFFGLSALPEEMKKGGQFFDLKGKQVSFELGEPSADGKPAASSVWLEAGEGQRIVGQVKSYNPLKGFGFVGSSSLQGQDFFFSHRDVRPELKNSELKTLYCSFVVKAAQADGKLQAGQLQFQDATGPMQRQMMMPMMSMGMSPMAAMSPMAWGSPSLMHGKGGKGQVGDGQAMQGAVVSFNAAKGWGFLNTSVGDVYFKDSSGQYGPGTPVSFLLKIMPDGKFQARDVSPGLADGETHSGTVTSYSAKNGWGFIAVPNYAAEVYFKKEMVNAEVGEEFQGTPVTVTIQLSQDGKPRASSVEISGARGSAPIRKAGVKRAVAHAGPTAMQAQKKMRPSPGGAGGKMSGTVLSYNPVKGFGFIQSPSVPGDVFLHKHMLQDSGVEAAQELQGRSVSFQLATSPQGKLQATNIQVHPHH